MSAPALILVRPQLGENIGAVARAMHNFGCADLRLVAPKNGWPNERAYDMATGSATTVLDAARVFATTEEALFDITFALATTARDRDMPKPVCSPREAAKKLHAQAGKTALLFGPERTGLENDDLALVDLLITIPTAPEHASLNLSQAAVVLLYEWFSSSCGLTTPASQDLALVTKEELHGFFSQLEEYLDAVDHFRTEDKKPLMWQNLRAIFARAQLSEQEVRTLRGVIRALFLRRRQED